MTNAIHTLHTMKHLILLFFLLAGNLLAKEVMCQSATADSTTTFILVRHAEKADNSPNTNLSEAGQDRAKALLRLLSHVKIDAIYTTGLHRTQQTAQFVADHNGLAIQTYEIDANFPSLTDLLAKKYKGKTVMIVGHSNTLPINIARLTKTKVEIPESEFDNVYIIQGYGQSEPKILQLKYGN